MARAEDAIAARGGTGACGVSALGGEYERRTRRNHERVLLVSGQAAVSRPNRPSIRRLNGSRWRFDQHWFNGNDETLGEHVSRRAILVVGNGRLLMNLPTNTVSVQLTNHCNV